MRNVEKLDITDLDIAYMAIFEEGNHEYMMYQALEEGKGKL